MKHLLLLCLLTTSCIFNNSSAQSLRSDKITPRWVKQTPAQIGASQRFIVFSYSSSSQYEDKKSKLTKLESYVERESRACGTYSKNTSNQSRTESRLDIENDTENYDERVTTKQNSDIKQEEKSAFKINEYNSNQIDEYWELVGPNHYLHYYLYSVSTSDVNRYNEAVTVTSLYGAQGLWRSAIVPGWGQMYKGSTGKGIAMLASTVAFAGGIIATDNLRNTYINRINQTHDINAIRNYATKADNMALSRNICIAGAIAMYAYNLIDAIAAPGARRVVVNSNVLNNFSFAPTANQYFAGVSLSYKF